MLFGRKGGIYGTPHQIAKPVQLHGDRGEGAEERDREVWRLARAEVNGNQK